MRARLLQTLEAFHQANPLREWMPCEELRAGGSARFRRRFNLVLQQAQREGVLEVQGEGARRAATASPSTRRRKRWRGA